MRSRAGRVIRTMALLASTGASATLAQNLITDWIGADDSIEITFTGGPVIVYGATVDDTTNDPSAEFLPYLYWL